MTTSAPTLLPDMPSQRTPRQSRSSGVDRHESQLLARVAAGDAQAFEALYGQYERLVRRALQARLRNPDLVEEALNDVMFVLWTSSQRVPDDVPLGAWLIGVTRNIALKHQARLMQRVRSQSLPSSMSTDDDPAPPPEVALLEREQIQVLTRALDSVPRVERTPLEMVIFEGASYRDIATQTDTNINTVKSRITRARRRLLDGGTSSRQALLNLSETLASKR
ncbi:MAG: RNA polymerase sigma factor [Gammaproteobacteria bacterium]|nr:RNA polymerase sigma factor [Gammaproteobacteria bacterium]